MIHAFEALWPLALLKLIVDDWLQVDLKDFSDFYIFC